MAYVNRDWAMHVAKYLYNWEFFGQEVLRKSKVQCYLELIPEVVTGKHNTIQDLHVDPVSFKNGIFELIRENIFDPAMRDEDE